MVDAWEAHAGGVRASSMIRDDDSPGDFLNVLLDTFGDRQTAVTFSTTPGGQRNDWTISNDAREDGSLSPAWNGVWDLAVRRGPDGWHAEYRIPFTTLQVHARNGRARAGAQYQPAHRTLQRAGHLPSHRALGGERALEAVALAAGQHREHHHCPELRVMPYIMAGSEGPARPILCSRRGIATSASRRVATSRPRSRPTSRST